MEGCNNLPPGFRFFPTDEELLVQYLMRKAFSVPLPADVVSDIDLYKYNPWELPGDEKEKYFFTKREAKYPKGNRSNRACQSGYWKATGKDRMVVGRRSNQVVGMKKSLVFYRGKPPKGSKTDWVMHEYRLCDAGSRPFIFPQGKNPSDMEDWVLCRIFLKKDAQRRIPTASSSHDEETPYCAGGGVVRDRNPMSMSMMNRSRPQFIDFMRAGDREVENSSEATSTITSDADADADADADDTTTTLAPPPMEMEVSTCTSKHLFPLKKE